MEASKVLGNYELKTTACRSEVLSIFFKSKEALTQSNIEKRVGSAHDRVTIYRTLKSFLEKGLIHKVLDDGSGVKYALCSECAKDFHNHEHVHFKCESCNQTLCLDTVGIPKIDLPVGYTINEKNLLIQGVCKNCSSK